MNKLANEGTVAPSAAEQESPPFESHARGRKETGAELITKRARLRFTLRLRPKALKLFARYESLRSLGNDQKNELRAVVRESILLHLYLRAMTNRVVDWTSMIIVLLLFVAVGGAPQLAAFLTGSPQGRDFGSIFAAAGKTLFGLSALAVIILGPFMLLGQFISLRAQKYFAFQRMMQWVLLIELAGLAVCSASLSMFARARPLDDSELSFLSASLAFVIYCGVVILFVNPALATFRSWLDRRAQRIYTGTFLVTEFFSALADVEGTTARDWADINFRKKVIARLEKVATCVERVIPAQMRSGNPATDQWLSESAEEMAAGVRALAKWVMTPKADTREQLVTRLASNLVHAARGDWDGFERAKPERLSRPDLIRTRGANLLKAAALASIPILVLLAVKRLGLAPDGTVLTYLTVGGYVWAALTLLSGLDPAYGAKITAIKDITGFLPLPGKSKSE
jgi:hypothetical protein